jgi:hypothetical protein
MNGVSKTYDTIGAMKSMIEIAAALEQILKDGIREPRTITAL